MILLVDGTNYTLTESNDIYTSPTLIIKYRCSTLAENYNECLTGSPINNTFCLTGENICE